MLTLTRTIEPTVATRIVFFIAGFIISTWAVIVPFAKENTSANDAVLGLLLLSLGVGALIAMPLTGLFTTHLGCRCVILLATLAVALMLPLLTLVTQTHLLAVLLLLYGFGIGVIDCAMNIQAVVIDKLAPKPIMSSFHAMYSVGGMVGVGFTTLLLNLKVTLMNTCIIDAVIMIALLLISTHGLLPQIKMDKPQTVTLPRGDVLLIGLVCLAIFLVEGAVLDWSAIFLVEHRGVTHSLGGLGFFFFVTAMTITRFVGDNLITTFNSLSVVLVGLLVAIIGLAIVICIQAWTMTLLGYMLVGAGCANIVPIMFSAAGRNQAMPECVAIPSIVMLGYLGVLGGPAVIGYISYNGSLVEAFIFLLFLLLLVALSMRFIKLYDGKEGKKIDP